MASKFRKGAHVVFLDHEETPWILVGKIGMVDHARSGYVGVIARDIDGHIVRETPYAERTGVTIVPYEAVRRLSPMEELALAADG